MRRIVLSAVRLFLMVCIVASCASIRAAPEQIGQISENDLKQNIEETRTNYLNVPVDKTGLADRTKWRNQYILFRMQAIDLAFTDYVNDFGAESRSLLVLSNLAIVGVGAAGSVVGAGASKLLSAASAGIAGGTQAYQKELLFDRTVYALISAMRGDRAKIKLNIIQKVGFSDDVYSFIAAESDLHEYEHAGRLDAAITSVVEQTAAAANKAEQDLLEVQIKEFTVDLTERVFDGINALTEEQAKSLVNNLPVDYDANYISKVAPRGGLEAAAANEASAKSFLRNLILNRPERSEMKAWLGRLEVISTTETSINQLSSDDLNEPATIDIAGAEGDELRRIRLAELAHVSRGDMIKVQQKLGFTGNELDGIWGLISQQRLEVVAQAKLLTLSSDDTILTADVIQRIIAAPNSDENAPE